MNRQFITAPTQESPRFVGPTTFFRAPALYDSEGWGNLDIGLVGIPYDGGTTNRPGARLGPRSLREQSTMIAPSNPSLNFLNPFNLCKVADIGDAWVREPFNLESSLNEIQQFFAIMHAAGVVPVSAGGDHSVSLPILRAIASEGPVGMVHIDAHCDTGDGFMGSRYHHGAPFSRAVEEGVLDPKRTAQIGIRGPLNGDVWRFSRTSGMRVVSMDEWCDRGVADVMSEVREIVGDAPCYLSFDIDALDPAFAPGTGTPVVGGFSTREAIQMIRRLRGLNLIGADLVELSPPFDVGSTTSLAAATLMFEILCIVSESYSSRMGRS